MRTMTLRDVDAVLAIEQAVQAYPWTRGNFTDALDHGYLCCVDDTGGEISGYAILMPVLDEAELLNIGVAAAQQRKGVGRAMLLEMLDLACKKNLLRVFLEVRSSNVAALALYRSAGFGEIGLRRGYYRNVDGSEDAITMACDLVGELDG
ncbi:MAG: ribosomal protein S18-alanine N-acetyltransferase [Nitrosomonadales bacterium]|nr:ribosomal protein S18-alanine N-acetyltransferase [Nitrosomonadales bacterium]